MGWSSLFGKKAPPLQQALDEAIAQLDVQAVRRILEEGADPNGEEKVEISPLITALVHPGTWLSQKRQAQVNIIKALLQAGARPEWGGTGGQNPLELALRKGDLEATQLLLGRGHSATLLSQTGPTPLQQVLSVIDYKGWPLAPLVDALVKSGASVEKCPSRFGNPFDIAMDNSALLLANDLEEVFILLLMGTKDDALVPFERLRHYATNRQWKRLLTSLDGREAG